MVCISRSLSSSCFEQEEGLWLTARLRYYTGKRRTRSPGQSQGIDGCVNDIQCHLYGYSGTSSSLARTSIFAIVLLICSV
jgi:hypothetical protein